MTSTIFDFNGVLVDDEHVHFASFAETLQPLGVALEKSRYEEHYIGFDDAGAFRAILRDAGQSPSEADIAHLVEAKKPIYMRQIEHGLVIFEGATEIVLRRAALGTVGIVSGALRHEIEHALSVMNVRSAVAFIVSAEDAPRCKPDPQGYELALQKLHPNERRAVVIEDSVAGVQAAKAAGLMCAAVEHSYPAAKLREAGAYVVVPKISLLTDTLLNAPGTA
jgi:HAD superfamily hydrolase (TIGR01509 family)